MILPCWIRLWATFKSLTSYVSTGTAVGQEGASAWTNITVQGETLAEMKPAGISCTLVPIPCHCCSDTLQSAQKLSLCDVYFH